MQTKKVAVVGGAGYAGIESVRFLLGHPGFELVAVTSDGDAGKPLTELYPALIGKTQLAFSHHDSIDALTDLDAVFLAVPHTAALSMAPSLVARGVAVFDLSADFRLKDPAVYEKWYGAPHTAPDLLASAVYGLPELNRSLLAKKGQGLEQDLEPGSQAQQTQQSPQSQQAPVVVACPGCYPTASTLAVAPALRAGLVAEGPVIINAISGVSGAGRSPSQGNQFCTANENLKAYGVATHRHTPEIAQTLSGIAGRQVSVVFTPHLAPLTRGLLSTVTVPIKSGVTPEDLARAYAEAYGAEPFAHALPYGAMPQTASVVGTNNAQVGIMLDEATGMLIASCAIDNLGKGAASQAIQCANIVFGFGETDGLAGIAGVV